MRHTTAIVFSVLALVSIGVTVNAAEWTQSASITPGVTYTDNVCLSRDNKQDQWIGTVTPAGSINANGNRANFSVAGSVELNTLSDSKLDNLGCTGGNFGNREQFAPRLNGSGDVILLDDWLFVDGTAAIAQNQATPFASGGDDPFNRTGNTNTTYNYSVSPYIAHRFKDTAQLNLRYTWDDQYNSTDVVGDSGEQRVNGTLSSVPGAAKFSWGLQGDYSKTDYSDSNGLVDDQSNSDSELKSAQLNVGYQLTGSWQVNGFYGNEWNDFVSTRDDIDGEFWDVGLRWTPNARTTVDVGSGHRFFGNSPRFSVAYRHKRSALNASYARTLTYDRNLRTLPNSPPLNPDFPPPPGVDPGLTTISNSPILDERFTLGYSYQGRRSRLGVSMFQSEQTQEADSTANAFSESSYRGVSVSGSRQLSGLLSLNAGLNWNEQEPKNSGGGAIDEFFDNSKTWTATLGVERQLSQRTSLGFNYQYTDRDSDNEINAYKENQITLDLVVNL